MEDLYSFVSMVFTLLDKHVRNYNGLTAWLHKTSLHRAKEA